MEDDEECAGEVIIGSEDDGDGDGDSDHKGIKAIFKSIRVSKISTSNQVSTQRHNKKTRQFVYYRKAIVDEKKTAKVAKEKVSAVRKLDSTKRKAEQVYIKHGVDFCS